MLRLTLLLALATAACAPGSVECGDACDAPGDDGGDGDALPMADPVDARSFGPLAVGDSGTDLAFAVPGDLASFTVTLSAPDPGDARLGFDSLTAPDGTVLYTLGGDPNINPALDPYPGALSIMVPTSDDARGRPTAGTYHARIGLFATADEVVYTPVDGTIAAAAITVKDTPGGTLNLRIAMTPSTSLAAGDEFMTAALAELQHYYVDVAGFTVGTPTYATLPDTFDHIDSADLVRAACAAGAETSADDPRVNVFIVSDMTFTQGLSGGVPGPPYLSHTDASCVLLAKQSTAQATGALMSHEVGHFLGLFHTSQVVYDDTSNAYELLGYDALSDTPECPHGTPALSDCPDYSNMMFPFFPTSGLMITAAQVTIIAGSPWLAQPPPASTAK